MRADTWPGVGYGYKVEAWSQAGYSIEAISTTLGECRWRLRSDRGDVTILEAGQGTSTPAGLFQVAADGQSLMFAPQGQPVQNVWRVGKATSAPETVRTASQQAALASGMFFNSRFDPLVEALRAGAQALRNPNKPPAPSEPTPDQRRIDFDASES